MNYDINYRYISLYLIFLHKDFILNPSLVLLFSPFAALREYFKAKDGNCSSEPIAIKVDTKNEVTKDNKRVMEHVMEDKAGKDISHCTSLTDMNDSDEFFDAYERM